ncbi:MAG: prepilin-type N-terminal cleavage/methylation domain-containing protein [Thermodesulfobacteriota bacterium]|nr:prepilin-type N-terminal cleavage/methylation domain-containing protein [Thermodesulfobacteriota bacterium]
MKQKGLIGLKTNGFTLIEILVAMAISSIVASAIFMAYKAQQVSYVNQEQVAVMQQNLRAAMYFMEREIRMAGYDETGLAGAGIQTAAPNSIRFATDTAGGENDGIDNDEDGIVDEDTDGIDNDGDGFTDEADEGNEFRFGDGVLDDINEDITYSLFDIDGDNDNDLRRQDATIAPADPAFPEEEFVAENVQAIGFAYAFDANGDGDLDTYNAGGNEVVIWAIDSDGDNDLDTNLDTDGDSDIDAQDGPGEGTNGIIAGQALVDFDGNAIADVPVDDIRQVRIWMLVRSARMDRKFVNNHTYVVGNQVITPSTHPEKGMPASPNYRVHLRRMRLSETEIKCRNMGI